MANYDAGHYFLTALIPLRDGAVEIDGRLVSHRQRVEELLAALPNGEWLGEPHAAGSQRPGICFSPCSRSPFTRNAHTHFTRLVVIDDLPYNGRQSGDTLLGILLQTNLLVAQPVERLNQAWLLWCAEFDADGDTSSGLDRWLGQLWQQVGPELSAVLEHAVAFESVDDAASFTTYIRRCQVETTLPFNDYWAHLPALRDVNLRIPKLFGIVGALALLPGLLGALLLPMLSWLGLVRQAAYLGGGRAAGEALVIGILLLAAAAVWALVAIRAAAARPFPPPAPPDPPSTLPSVLKALHLQEAFANFASEAQSLDADALHARFAVFLDRHRPDDLSTATQAPGELGL